MPHMTNLDSRMKVEKGLLKRLKIPGEGLIIKFFMHVERSEKDDGAWFP